ncbi:unnamed protein product [Sphagnum jensenii]|uniref:non-specific serine/threonine protein kinase n=1 Tax=Sphagnum jensenii TaxID=128206 RepID=A0ABP1AR24_9BRYO
MAMDSPINHQAIFNYKPMGEEETSLEKKEETERMRILVDKDRNRKSDKEPGEISDDSGGRILMEVEEEEDIGSQEQMESIVVKKRKYSAVVVKHGGKHARSDVVSDVLDGPEDVASVPTDGVEELRERGEAAELAPEDMETVSPEGHKSSRSKRSSRKSSRRQRNQEDSSERHERRSGCSKSRDRGQRSRARDQGNRSRSRESMVVDGSTMTDNLDRKRRSRSRESLLERKGEDKSVDVKKHRSKAKDSAREQTLMQEIKLERHRRSRESTHDRKDNGQEGSKDPSERNREQSHRDGRAHGEVRGMEERRRSRSKESLLNPKVEDCVRRKWESPSKDFVHDKVRENIRKLADCHDLKRYSSRSNDAPAQGTQNHQQEQEFSRHGGWADKSHVRNHKETCEWMGADSLDKRQRSHSRDSVREADKYLSRDKHVEKDKSHGHDEKCVPRDETKRKIEEDARFISAQFKYLEEENEEEYKERIELQLAAQEEDDLERIKEESRRRRQAILEKYKQLQQQKSNAEQLNDSSKQPEEQGQLVAAVGATNLVKQTNDDAVSLDKVYCRNGDTSVQAMPEIRLDEGSSPKSERSADMFCDDIFGESPAGGRKTGKGDGMVIDTSGLTDNWDDAEGRYSFRIGEILDGRYEILSSHGSGVFSTVVRARDMKAGRGDPEVVAIKIIRNNETMYRTGQHESVILRKLSGADPNNRRHCVQLFSTFEYRNHLCLVFESLHMNLREILKTFGRNIGIRLTAVQAYAKQLFIALKHLRNCRVLHCDIKPDNMLVNDAKNVLKLCDFGSAMFAGENEITPYLVSRFYRAPEIILGLPYDHALDVWSVGCCLYELYSGKMLFPGHTNNDMLRLHMELKGPFSKKMLKKAAFVDEHFDQDYNFCAVEEDPVTKKIVKRIMVNIKPKDMGLLFASSRTCDEDPKTVAQFKDLLEKMFILDPDKRMTVSQALNHPFISGK